MTSASGTSLRAVRVWIFLLIALAVFSFFAMRRSVSRAMGMKAETMADSAFTRLKPGDEAKLVLELTATEANSLNGRVLEKQDETNYRRTPDITEVRFDATTKIVMGKASDLHRGAVVHVTAKMGNDRVLHASQIVILTGYVHVQ